MSRRNKIIYWITTLWLSLGMASTGIVQLLKVDSEIAFIVNMGYPVYFLTILGIWKIFGVVAVLIPKFPLIKEWAYAGFFFSRHRTWEGDIGKKRYQVSGKQTVGL